MKHVFVDIGPFNEEGAAYFKKQRSLISAIREDHIPTRAERELLEGLMNLLDTIADQLHDDYGFDTLFSETE